MKLRLHQHTVRLRLDDDDMDHLIRTGRVEAATAFAPDITLRYAVEASGVEDYSIRSERAGFTILIPEDSVRSWAATDRVGFSFTYPGGGQQPVEYTVEKDLGCRHGDGEVGDRR